MAKKLKMANVKGMGIFREFGNVRPRGGTKGRSANGRGEALAAR
jgi:hypothetical protein